MDASNQLEVDDAMLNIGGPDAKQRLGGNATAAVSAAVLKAGAAALGIPLYQHIGGVTAFTLPVPGVIAMVGSDRYGSGARSGGKPSYSFMAYGFDDLLRRLVRRLGPFDRVGERAPQKAWHPQASVRCMPPSSRPAWSSTTARSGT